MYIYIWCILDSHMTMYVFNKFMIRYIHTYIWVTHTWWWPTCILSCQTRTIHQAEHSCYHSAGWFSVMHLEAMPACGSCIQAVALRGDCCVDLLPQHQHEMWSEAKYIYIRTESTCCAITHLHCTRAWFHLGAACSKECALAITSMPRQLSWCAFHQTYSLPNWLWALTNLIWYSMY